MAPLLDDDDVVSKKTDKASGPTAKERMAERAQKASKGELDSEEDAPVIDVSERDDEDADRDDDEPVAKTGSVRQEKKRNRYREMSDRAAAAERARQETEARFSQMMSLYERTVASQQRANTAPEKDEFDAKLEGIYREQETLYTELQIKARTLTQQDKERIERRAKELDAEKIAVSVQKHMRQNGGGQQYRGPADTMQAMLQIEFPEVVGHEDALGWAQGYYQMARREGRAASIDLARESMTKARARFRLAGGPERRPPPAAAAREKYAGVGAGGGGRDTDVDREEITMSKPFRKMANGKYGHIKDEKKRYQMWAQGPGKRLLAAQRAKHSA